jgi:WhiB family redox-sensing transcriptional regulator
VRYFWPAAKAWMLRGRCVDRDPEVFFPSSESAAAARPAKRVCGPCPVIDECREFALSTRQDFGVWGGLAGAERLTALRERTAS